jgi:glycosyltransferase involved in cell wall biosynthesis
MPPLRVAQIITKLTAGAGGVTLRGAVALDPDQYSTTIFAAENGSLIDRAEQEGLQVIRLQHMARDRRVSPQTEVQGLRELASHLKAEDFDLVHTHSMRAGVLGRLAARRAGIGAIVHSFHGFPFHGYQSAASRRVLLATERRLAAITDYFLTAGTMVAAEAVRLKIAPPDRVRAIAVPIDNDIAPASGPARREARRLIGIPAEAKVVGTAARLDAQKAPLDMVEAIAALPEPRPYMVWIGDGNLRKKVERLADRRGIRDRFLLLGERDDVARLLPAFDVFALSSLFEGLPCALVEAMTCGVPVVSTAVNSVPEIVISGKTGILARPADPASLSRALAYMLDHPADAQRMASAARAQVGQRFRPEVLGRDLMEVYEIALGRAG